MSNLNTFVVFWSHLTLTTHFKLKWYKWITFSLTLDTRTCSFPNLISIHDSDQQNCNKQNYNSCNNDGNCWVVWLSSKKKIHINKTNESFSQPCKHLLFLNRQRQITTGWTYAIQSLICLLNWMARKGDWMG